MMTQRFKDQWVNTHLSCLGIIICISNPGSFSFHTTDNHSFSPGSITPCIITALLRINSLSGCTFCFAGNHRHSPSSFSRHCYKHIISIKYIPVHEAPRNLARCHRSFWIMFSVQGKCICNHEWTKTDENVLVLIYTKVNCNSVPDGQTATKFPRSITAYLSRNCENLRQLCPFDLIYAWNIVSDARP